MIEDGVQGFLLHFIPDRLVRNLRCAGGVSTFDAELCFHGGLDLSIEGVVAFEDFLGGVAALGELAAFVADPRAALLEDFLFEGEVEEAAGASRGCGFHPDDG